MGGSKERGWKVEMWSKGEEVRDDEYTVEKEIQTYDLDEIIGRECKQHVTKKEKS